MSKPPKFSRRTGTVSKAKRMQGLDKYFRNARVISNQAKVAVYKLEQKINKEELDWCAYDCKERRHAHEEELKKRGKVIKKIDFNKFEPLYGEKKLRRFNLLANRSLSLKPKNALLHFSGLSNFAKIDDQLNATVRLQATFNPTNALAKHFAETWKKPERELRSRMALSVQTYTGSATFNKQKNTKST